MSVLYERMGGNCALFPILCRVMGYRYPMRPPYEQLHPPDLQHHPRPATRHSGKQGQAMSVSWSYTSNKQEALTKTTEATRAMVGFAVLDFDSLTNVTINNAPYHVVAMIYKKITVAHSQTKEFDVTDTNTDPSNAIKLFHVSSAPIQAATYTTDLFKYFGTRKVEYEFVIVVNGEKHTYPTLNTLNSEVSGSYDIKGRYDDLTNNAGTPESIGPTHTISGNRLFGVSVYVGSNYCVFSYDEETLVSTYDIGSTYDSPMNFEDWNTDSIGNTVWEKSERVVGCVNFKNMELSTKRYPASRFSDKLYSVAYQDLRR